VALNPRAWLPWNYREALDAASSHAAAVAAS